MKTLLLSVQLLFIPASLYAFDIQLDYSYDTSNFFNGHDDRKTSLTTAVSVFTSRITTVLSEISPSGENTWTNSFWNPANMANSVTLNNSTIAANKLVVYVGGCNQSTKDPSLALGGPGWSTVSGSDEWQSTVNDRGRATSVFSPWGGTMSFDTSADTSWYFGSDTAVPEGQYDFYSVAIHEMGHVLGIGTATEWTSKVSLIDSIYYFTGAGSVASYGSNVPTSGASDQNAHWKDGTMSTVPITGASQEARMTPVINSGGTRQYFTELDWAALKDIGWDIASVPEPSAVVLFAAGLLGLAGFGIMRFKK